MKLLKFDFSEFNEQVFTERPDDIIINMYGKLEALQEDAAFLSWLAQQFPDTNIYLLNLRKQVKESLLFVINANKNLNIMLK